MGRIRRFAKKRGPIWISGRRVSGNCSEYFSVAARKGARGLHAGALSLGMDLVNEDRDLVGPQVLTALCTDRQRSRHDAENLSEVRQLNIDLIEAGEAGSRSGKQHDWLIAQCYVWRRRA